VVKGTPLLFHSLRDPGAFFFDSNPIRHYIADYQFAIPMHTDSNKLSRFWNELKRRKVVRIFIVYIAAGFAIIEFVDIVSDPLSLPEWALALAIILVVAGFPIALIFAWIFEYTDKVIKKTGPEKSAGKVPLIPPENSIVVLPFENMSPDPDQEYFSDGLTEEIINALVHVSSLKVIARTSSFAYKGKYDDVRKIGSKLNVEHVLEGSVRKTENKLRITAQLIQVTDGMHIWSETYDSGIKDIFQIQDEISLAIVKQLKVNLLEEEKDQILKVPTENMEAYHLFLKGRHLWYNDRSKAGLAQTTKYYQKAIDTDPTYALAYADLANTLLSQIDWGYLHPTESLPRIQELIWKALELDSTIAEAYISQVYSIGYSYLQWDKVDLYVSKALELNPNSAGIHHWTAMYKMATGDFQDAIEHNNIARKLDPLSTIFNFAFGLILHMAGKGEESLQQFRKTNTLDPNFVLAHLWAAFPRIRWGQEEEAVKGYQTLLMHSSTTADLAPKIMEIYKQDGIRGFLHWIIHEGLDLDNGIYNHPYWKAVCHSLLNEKDPAFKELEKLFELNSPRRAYIKIDPSLDNLRADPRFDEILKRLQIQQSMK
jgi:adenylate cyclase